MGVAEKPTINPSTARSDSPLLLAATDAIYRGLQKQIERIEDRSAWGDRTDVQINSETVDLRQVARDVVAAISEAME